MWTTCTQYRLRDHRPLSACLLAISALISCSQAQSDAATTINRLFACELDDPFLHIDSACDFDSMTLSSFCAGCKTKAEPSYTSESYAVLYVSFDCMFYPSRAYIHCTRRGDRWVMLGLAPAPYHGRWHMGKGVEEIDKSDNWLVDTLYAQLVRHEDMIEALTIEFGSDAPLRTTKLAFDRQLAQDRLVIGPHDALKSHFEDHLSSFDSIAQNLISHGDPHDTLQLRTGHDPGELLIEHAYADMSRRVHMVIGGTNGEEIGYLRASVPNGFPAPSLSDYALIEHLTDQWALYVRVPSDKRQ